MDEIVSKDTPAAPPAPAVPAIKPPVPKSPEALTMVEHMDWLLSTMNGWVVDGWQNEVRGRLLIVRDLAIKLP